MGEPLPRPDLLLLGERSAATSVASASRSRGALLTGLVLLVTALGFQAMTASRVQASEQYVLSVGIVDQIGGDRLTLRFDDGVTEAYRMDRATAIQTQNGDALRLADLEVGQMAVVLTVENDSVALTIVSGGEEGFHDAGPGDIRGHDERECAADDAPSL